MSLIALTAAIAAATPANIIVNPGFESGLSGWSLVNPSLVGVSNSVVHSGSSALEFTMGTFGSTIAYQTFSPPVPFPFPRYSFWYRLDDLAASRLFLEARIEGSPLPAFVVPTPVPNEWTYVDLGPRIFDPQARGIRFYASLRGGAAASGAKIYLDDVDFVPAPGASFGVLGGFVLLCRRERRATRPSCKC